MFEDRINSRRDFISRQAEVITRQRSVIGAADELADAIRKYMAGNAPAADVNDCLARFERAKQT